VLFLAALAAPSAPALSVPAQAEARIDPAPPGYALRAWGPESGAPTDIRTIAQTPDGFLWLGTGNGLYRFDGLSFERIEPVAYERRRSATILTMAVASDGALWMGRDYGGVSVWRNGRLEDLPRDQQVKGAVQAITAGPQGDVWIATIGGLGPQLHLFRHGRWSLISPETGLQDESIDHLMVARDGTLWIAQGASVSRIAPGGSRPALVLRHPAYPATLAQDDEGAVWMTSAKGMERLTGRPMIRALPSTVPAPGLFQHGGLIFADGAAWLSAYRDGLMLAPRSRPARRTSMAVTVLFRDAEGSLWGGGADGLLRLRRSDVIRVALAGAPTTGFAQGGPPAAPLYLGTDTGVVGIEAGAPRLIHQGGDMTAICAGQQGQLLAMAQTKGFVRQGGRWRYLPPPPDAAPTGSCAITSDGRILNIMGNVNIAQLDGQRWKGWQPAQNWQFGVSDGQKGLFTLRPTTSLTHLTPDGQSEIWNREQIATGFMRMLRPFGPELYIGGEQGLARMRGGRIVTLDAHHHPWLAGITGLAMGRGRVWIISGAGIADVERGRWDSAFAHPEQPIPHRLHGDHEGIHARRDVYWAANDAEIDAEGRPWFVTNRGLVRIEPEGGAAPAPAPPVVIRSLVADGRVYRDYHAYIDWRWMFMELATLAAGAAMLWRYPLPFLVMPLAATLWYMSMDLTPFLFGAADATWELRRLVSLWFGLLIALLAFWVDVRSRHDKDYAFWLYLFGVVAFWGGLSTMNSDSELSKFLYLCINLLMIVVGATLARRVFAVFGGLGAAGYVGHLAHGVFKDSLIFPFVLTAIGLGVIYAGIVWQRHEKAITARLRNLLPPPLRELVARRH